MRSTICRAEVPFRTATPLTAYSTSSGATRPERSAWPGVPSGERWKPFTTSVPPRLLRMTMPSGPSPNSITSMRLAELIAIRNGSRMQRARSATASPLGLWPASSIDSHERSSSRTCDASFVA